MESRYRGNYCPDTCDRLRVLVAVATNCTSLYHWFQWVVACNNPFLPHEHDSSHPMNAHELFPSRPNHSVPAPGGGHSPIKRIYKNLRSKNRLRSSDRAPSRFALTLFWASWALRSSGGASSRFALTSFWAPWVLRSSGGANVDIDLDTVRITSPGTIKYAFILSVCETKCNFALQTPAGRES